MKKWIGILGLAATLGGCKSENTVEQGLWRAEVPTAVGMAPIHFEIQPAGDSLQVTLLNGTERLAMDKAYWQADSLVMPMEIYDSKLVAKVTDKTMTGTYQKKTAKGGIVSIPFTATHGQTHRFVASSASTAAQAVSGKWATTFFRADSTSYQAIGVFEQKGNDLTGTFLTATGDYRFLQGNVVGDSLKLSCFDGTHLFLFTAKIAGDSLVGGRFGSGATYNERWTAKKDNNAALPDAKKLTYLKPGYDRIDFTFPNQAGKMISLTDPAYQGKVVAVQIMGSWCPNCMDETRFLVPFYQKYKTKGFEAIGLSYERGNLPAKDHPKLKQMKDRYGIPYEVLLAGTPDEGSPEASLPMLNQVMAFPTMIIIDRKGHVHEIHTGFSGPGTGNYYEEFVKEFTATIEKLLADK